MVRQQDVGLTTPPADEDMTENISQSCEILLFSRSRTNFESRLMLNFQLPALMAALQKPQLYRNHSSLEALIACKDSWELWFKLKQSKCIQFNQFDLFYFKLQVQTNSTKCCHMRKSHCNQATLWRTVPWKTAWTCMSCSLSLLVV